MTEQSTYLPPTNGVCFWAPDYEGLSGATLHTVRGVSRSYFARIKDEFDESLGEEDFDVIVEHHIDGECVSDFTIRRQMAQRVLDALEQ